MNDMAQNNLFDTFPLDQWFDISKPIRKTDISNCEEEILLHAYKDGIDIDGSEVKRAIRSLKYAARNHNKMFK